jgi:peptide/nickel transport system substrate-binding protein
VIQLFQLARTLGKDGGLNWGGYSNPQVDELLLKLRGELDSSNRQALSRQIQQLAGADIPTVFLVVAPIVSVYRTSSVMNFTPHPDDTYMVDTSLAVS